MLKEGLKIRDYRLVRRLGGGGMGEVWEAVHEVLDRRVAIKCLPQKLSSDSRFLERFESEVKTLANLNHDQIVTVYDGFRHENELYLVMELIPGCTLAEILLEGTRTTRNQCMEWFRQVAEALVYVHGRCVRHRDIKPSNIMIDRSGRARLIDFGIAFSEGRGSRLTRTGESPGTPPLMPPEQFFENKTDERTDIYALALTMLYVWSGKRPVRRPDGSHACDVPQNTPESIRRIFQRCLVPDPEQRYPDAEHLLEDIVAVLEWRGPVRRWKRVHTVAACAAIAAGVVAVLFSALRGGPPGMVRIPAGEYISGMSLDQIPKDINVNEYAGWEVITRGGPQKRSLDAFLLDKHEVTNAAYAEFVRATSWPPPPHWNGKEPPVEISLHPVCYVTWSDAAAYANWVGKRLPTADEWEKAARGPEGRIYPWGAVFDSASCNTYESAFPGICDVDAAPRDISPYGIIGMGGNVAEWTASKGEAEGAYVICGGSWLEEGPLVSLSAFRRVVDGTLSGPHVGFRCAK